MKRLLIVGLLLCVVLGLESMIKKKNPLETYRKKRVFSKTTEPKGTLKKKKAPEPLFVIHKHDASHEHYDLRLEIEGVLKSWAVPKGPSTDPDVKRLAIPTEDHPYDYAFFEGIIPPGNYGAGTVMIWDIGTYTNIKDKSMIDCFDEGRIEVQFHGSKMKGTYAVIKTGDKRWLFFKTKNDTASERLFTQKSATTGRTMQQIARGEPEKK